MVFSKEQSAAITHVDGPMMVIAGPGSGKTTVITRRIKYMIESAGINPAEILVITFTKAAAMEMEGRFKKLTTGCDYSVRFGTFHSIFFWIIKTAYRLDNSCVISETEKRNLIEKIMRDINVKPENYGNKEDVISSIVSQIGVVKCDMIDIDSYYSRDLPESEFRQIYRYLEKEMKRLSKLDFDDMMVMCYELLKSRSDILSRIRNMFKYILVDEFQDSNKLQYEIFKLMAEPLDNAFIVGDDDQSVYGFRGARPEIMQQFKKDFSGTKEVYLSVNYRCDKAITKASSIVISENKNRFSKKLKSASENEGSVRIYYPKDPAEQNDSIVATIMENYKKGIPYDEQAVLYRTNIEPRRLAYKLQQYNIPYTLSDALPNIFENFVVKNVLNYIRFAMGDRKREIFLSIMNKPVRYITRDSLMEDEINFDILAKRYRTKPYAYENICRMELDIDRISKMKPFAAINYIRRGIGYDDYIANYAGEKNLDYEDMIDTLDELCYMVKDIESFDELFSFIEKYRIELSNIPRDKRKIKGVRLLTMHSSKGLEFDTVFIMDAVEGMTPYKKAKNKKELEEERRMFYVAMTRARHELLIYAPKTMSGKIKRPSRYINNKKK